jgi:hypothetical protein
VSNLDAVLLEARESLEALPGHLLADMEALLQLRHLQPAGAAEPGELRDAVAGAALRDTRRPTAFAPSGRLIALLRRAAQHTMPAPCLMMRRLVSLRTLWVAPSLYWPRRRCQPWLHMWQRPNVGEVPCLNSARLAAGEDEDGEKDTSRPSLRSSPSKGAHLSGVLGSAASFGSERSFKSEADATEDAAAFRQVSDSAACALHTSLVHSCCLCSRHAQDAVAHPGSHSSTVVRSAPNLHNNRVLLRCGTCGRSCSRSRRWRRGPQGARH